MILGSDQSQTARLEQNRQRSMRRREVTRAVRDVRERLSSDSGTRPAFDYEILLEYARNRLSSWLPVGLLILALGGTAAYWMAYQHVAIWAGAVFIAHTLIGFTFGAFFGFVAGYFQGSWVDKAASITAVLGVSVPHYWLGMVLVIVFSSQLMWLPATGAGPGGSF